MRLHEGKRQLAPLSAGNSSADTAVKSLGQFVFADDVVAHSFCPTDGSRSTSPQGETNQSLNVLLLHVDAFAWHAPAVHIGRMRLLTEMDTAIAATGRAAGQWR